MGEAKRAYEAHPGEPSKGKESINCHKRHKVPPPPLPGPTFKARMLHSKKSDSSEKGGRRWKYFVDCRELSKTAKFGFGVVFVAQ